jgi:hypothetical protein
MTVLNWLLDSDPSVRWQALRDLAGAPVEVVATERARVADEGWGARLLALQGEDGQWAGGSYFPARDDAPDRGDTVQGGDQVQGGDRAPGDDQVRGGDRAPGGDGKAAKADDAKADDAKADDAKADDESQPWTATMPTLMVLVDLGVDPQDERVRQAVEGVRNNSRWEEGGQPFFDGEVEPCINGRLVTLGAYFGQDVDPVVERLAGEQLADGGWNCWAEYGATRTSFHTTINVLEGLLAHERATGGSPASVAARRRGEEYLLERGLFRRRSTGDVVNPAWLLFSFPTRWHYDVLRALDYFRAVGDAPDPRLDEAVEVVRSKRRPDGTWPLENTHPGAVHFDLDEGDGRPSRWNTLRALRVLNWYGQGAG